MERMYSWLSVPRLLLTLVLIQASMLSYSAWIHSPTWDEPGHLAAGLSHWEFGRFDLYAVNPPLVRTVAAAPVALFTQPEMDWSLYRSDPVMRSEVLLGRRMIELNGERAFGFLFLARLALIPVALLGTLLCYLWGRDLFGFSSGLVAASLWVFSPMVLGFGALITPDLGAAVVLLAASFVFWKWLQEPCWSWTLAVAAALAVAMLTKSVWLMLPLIFGGIWGLAAWIDRRRSHIAAQESLSRLPRPRGQFAMLASATLLSILLVNLFYGFSGSFQPLGRYQFVSATLAGPAECEGCPAERGNRFAGSFIGRIPVPLPSRYLQGIDIQRRDFERGFYEPGWESYLWGEWQQGGWWYYYLVGLLVKESLVFWLMAVGGTLAACSWRPAERERLGLVCLGLPALVLIVVASTQTGLNRHVRYVLPVVPVMMIWASQITHLRWRNNLSPEEEGKLRGRKIPFGLGNCLGIVGCLVIAWSSLAAGPHWLSYFNRLVGGPQRGHEILSDSNLDWGQDLRLLKSWLAQHPEASEDLRLAYFGSFEPADVGIRYRLPPPLATDFDEYRLAGRQEQMGPMPGWHAVSVSYLQGHLMPVPDGRGRLQSIDGAVYGYFNEFEPTARIGHSIYIYHLRPEAVNVVRSQYGLAPLRSVRPASESESLAVR